MADITNKTKSREDTGDKHNGQTLRWTDEIIRGMLGGTMSMDEYDVVVRLLKDQDPVLLDDLNYLMYFARVTADKLADAVKGVTDK